MSDSYNSIFDIYRRFDSIFDIYPDKIHTGAVYGYRNPDGTLLEFPCTLDVSRAVKDDKGRWTASGLGLKPAFVKYSDNLKRAAKRIGAKKAWIGDGFAGGGMRSPSNNTIKKVRFLDDVTSIGCGAFELCTGLTSVTIPDSVTSIGDWAFYRCTSLTSIAIPNSVTSIEDMMFLYCSGLTSVVIPDGVKSIGYQAFMGCTSLTSITIPNSVTSIGEEAFWDCESLTDIYVNQAESTLLDSAFVPYGCTIHWNSSQGAKHV